MKLPRWLVSTMLSVSVLAVLSAAGWWVTWPERTARDFVRLLDDRRIDEARDLLAEEHRHKGLPPMLAGNFRANSRSCSDLILGRQRFTVSKTRQVIIYINGAGSIRDEEVRYSLTAQRGIIIIDGA